ncbi:MAG: hypothetical protein Kow0029_18780 [Candidatus Rifleibacteriota bacterium]
MKSFVLKMIIPVIVMSLCSFYLQSFERKRNVAGQESVSIHTWLIKTLNLRELAAGYLWMQFDNDSINQLANYHRLLITLDALTSIKEDDFDAWSLKNYMRLDRGIRKNDREMINRAIRDYKRAIELNPQDRRFLHDAAQSFYMKLHDLKLARKYAEMCYALPEHEVKTDRLLAKIYTDLKLTDKALKIYNEILQNPAADESDKALAREKIAKLYNNQAVNDKNLY